MALAYPRALFFPLLMTKASADRRDGGGGGTGAASGGRRLSKLTGLTADPSGEAFAEVKQQKFILRTYALVLPRLRRDLFFSRQGRALAFRRLFRLRIRLSQP